MPVPVGLILVAVVVTLGIAMLVVGTGLATRAASELGAAIGRAVENVSSQAPATPIASGAALETPEFDVPPNGGFTNQKTIALSGTVPAEIVGKSGYTVQVFSVTADKSRVRIAEVEVGGTVHFSVANVGLVEGANTFVARLVGPNIAGEESTPVSYTLKTTKPALTITSPGRTSSTTAATSSVSGKTDAGVTVLLQNAQLSGSSATATAGADGKFQLSVGLLAGSNTLVVTATDQAGNTNEARVTVKRDLGKLAAHLSVSPQSFSAGKPQVLTMTVHATSSDGSPLARAQVIFTVQIYGIGPITSPGTLKTDSGGTATWQTTITGAGAGPGLVSVLVTSGSTQVTDRVTVTTR